MAFLRITVLALLALFVFSLDSHANEPIDTLTAIMAVEANKGKPITTVTVVMDVLNTGEDKDRAFLNSELDYRVRASLNIAIPRKTRRKLTKIYGEDPVSFFKNKCIIVKGRPRHAKIRVTKADGTHSYYYQTHLPVRSHKQIKLCDALIS